MKKILTLLIAAGAFFTLHAQSREETRDIILGGSKDNGTSGNRDRDVILGGDNSNRYPIYPNNGSYGNNRQYQIEQVNREYDAKIYSIRNNRHLSRAEQDRMIRQLEKDRQRRIADITRSYNNRNDRYDDDRYNRHDNGKHKGWYKKEKNKKWKNGQYRNWDDD